MAGFNFGVAAKPVSVQAYLKAWSIYDNVEFGGISDPVTGTNSEGKSWKRWDISFKCKDGIYNEPIFEPKDASATERREVETSNGGKRELPSQMETFNLIVQQIVSVFMNDTNKEKFQKAAESGKFNNIEFSKFIDILRKLMDNPKKPTEDYPIQIKLQGRNHDGKVYAKLPNASISSKTGDAWLERFLGNNLTMTDYEKQQANATVNSKPTDMSSIDTPTATTTTSEDDINALADELDSELL